MPFTFDFSLFMFFSKLLFMNRTTILLASMLIAACCAFTSQAQDNLYHEHYRGQYHFSQRQGWISDPCGFLYYEGKFHCYWWGCAESEDLVHWDEQNNHSQLDVPHGKQCWTGCVVADVGNTAGFGEGKYISCLTHNDPAAKRQTQGLGISDDHGRTFSYYEGNPVLDIGYEDFRDPTVIWHEESQQWIMIVSKTLESKAAFYASKDLKKWEWLSDFGPAGRTYRCFECPDMFKLKVENGPHKGEERWVLVVSVDWDNEQYFVGDFDGREFHAEGLVDETGLYVDCAPDYYASRTVKDFSSSSSGKTLGGEVYSIGWMSNWTYCRLLPVYPGTEAQRGGGTKGFWSVPRRLSLRQTPDGLRLSQQPKEELKTLRGRQLDFKGRLKPGITPIKPIAALGNTYEAEVTFDCSSSLLGGPRGSGSTFGMNLCVGEGRKLVVTYSADSHSLVVDRTQVDDFSAEQKAKLCGKFERTCHSKVTPIDGKLKLRIFVDKNSVEIFSEDGLSVFSLQTFAADNHTAFEFFSIGAPTPYAMSVWPMASIWGNQK